MAKEQLEQGRNSGDARDGSDGVATGVLGQAADGARRAERVSARDWKLILNKAVHFAAALFLFILALQLMKEGAQEIGPAIKGEFPFANGVSTLGFGWITSYIVLSGSPVAVVSVTLFDSGGLTTLQTFTMVSGSRLGASFIVLAVGFLYAMRHRNQNRSESIGMGVMALSLTAIVYVPGMMIGYALLKSGILEGIKWQASGGLLSAIDLIWGPLVSLSRDLLPAPLLLPLGLAVILLSFKLLDRVLPQLDGERHAESRGHWLKRPWPMFFLGCLAAALTLSVAVALTVLVPLASKGYVKREEALPYIMGANITTLADTLFAAAVIGNAVAVQIVLAEVIGVTIITMIYLAFFYGILANGVTALDDWVVQSNRRLSLFAAGLFVLPVLFLLSGLVMGPRGT